MLVERSIVSFCKYNVNVTFECSLKILKLVTFKKQTNIKMFWMTFLCFENITTEQIN